MALVYDYFSYHEFLQDWFESARAQNSRFSQREFLRRAGISGSAVLHRVLQGQRIPVKYISPFCLAMGLNESETEYFETLVAYEDASSIQERGKVFSVLLRKRAVFPNYQMDDRGLKFFKTWYYPVVREVVNLLGGEVDYNRISRMVIPPITSIQAKNAVKFLEKNGFLERDQHGKLQLADPFFSTGAPRVSGLLASYHKKNLEINSEALELVEKELVSMSSLTLTVSQETYSKMREELADFRNRLMGMARKEQTPEQVFHLNFTFLPRSRKVGDKGEE